MVSKKFSGNHYLSERGIYFLIIFCVTMIPFIIKVKSHGTLQYLSGMCFLNALFLAWTTYLMNYFIVTQDEIIIKNHIVFWWELKIPLKKIEKMEITQPYNAPIKLTIYYALLQKKSFFGCSLRISTWRNFKKEILSKNIIISDHINL